MLGAHFCVKRSIAYNCFAERFFEISYLATNKKILNPKHAKSHPSLSSKTIMPLTILLRANLMQTCHVAKQTEELEFVLASLSATVRRTDKIVMPGTDKHEIG